MVIKAKNTKVLESSLQFTEDRTAVTFQANTELYVEGNIYPELVTVKTLKDLTCPVSSIANIAVVAQVQADEWVVNNYPAF